MRKFNDIKTSLSGYGLALFCVINGSLIKLGLEQSEWLAWILLGLGLGILGHFTKDKNEISNNSNMDKQKNRIN